MEQEKISAVIITRNEEKNITRCLDSLQNVADEIIVLDSFSADRTPELCKRNKVKFHQDKFDGFKEQKVKAIALAKNNYVLLLDADEELNEKLQYIVQNIDFKYRGYEFCRINNYCGKWIRFAGWYPEYRLRLFDKNFGRWEPRNVHEKYVIDESVGRLKGHLLHYSYTSVESHKNKALHYAELNAKELFTAGKRTNLFRIYLWPPVKFFIQYFFKLGILEGWRGFHICWINAMGTRHKYLYLAKLWREKK